MIVEVNVGVDANDCSAVINWLPEYLQPPQGTLLDLGATSVLFSFQSAARSGWPGSPLHLISSVQCGFRVVSFLSFCCRSEIRYKRALAWVSLVSFTATWASSDLCSRSRAGKSALSIASRRRSGELDQSLLPSDSCSWLSAASPGRGCAFKSCVTAGPCASEGKLLEGGSLHGGSLAGDRVAISRKDSCSLI